MLYSRGWYPLLLKQKVGVGWGEYVQGKMQTKHIKTLITKAKNEWKMRNSESVWSWVPEKAISKICTTLLWCYLYTPAFLPSSVPLLCHTHRAFMWPTMLPLPATPCTFTLSHTQNISVAYHYLPPSLTLLSHTHDISLAYRGATLCTFTVSHTGHFCGLPCRRYLPPSIPLLCLTHRAFLWLLAYLRSVSHTGRTFLWLLAYLRSVPHTGRTFIGF